MPTNTVILQPSTVRASMRQVNTQIVTIVCNGVQLYIVDTVAFEEDWHFWLKDIWLNGQFC
jgi:hypothetical protein